MLTQLGLIVAQTVTTVAGATSVKPPNDTAFFDAGVGQILQSVANVLAILVVVIGLWQTGKAIVAGRGGTAVKSVVGTIVLAAFMFNLQLMITLVKWMIEIVGKLFDTFSGAFGQ